MILHRRRLCLESWTVIRARMLRETQQFLEHGLRHPERFRRIPVVEMGKGSFRRGFADAFWSQVLATS